MEGRQENTGAPSLTRFHSFWLRLPPSSLSLRFKESIQTLGYVDTLNQVHCISPLLYESGYIPFTISMDNGRSFPHAGTWLAGEPSFCQASLGCYIFIDSTLSGPWFLSATQGHGTSPTTNPMCADTRPSLPTCRSG